MDIKRKFKVKSILLIKKEILLLFFLLLLFPPFPRVYVSVIFKIEFGIITVAFLIVSLLSLLKKKKFDYSLKYLFVFLFPIFWGLINGFFRGNQLYLMIKDICYFVIPLLVYLLLVNCEKWINKEFFSALFTYGSIVSLVQVFFSLLGVYLNVNRQIFRHVFLMLSTETIPFLLVLRIMQKGTLFDKRIFLFTIALLLTKGRSDLLFLILVFVGYFWWFFAKTLFLRRLYVFGINFAFSILWMFPIFFPGILKFFKPSLRWRYTEWKSLFVFFNSISFFDLLSGQGFGSLLPSLKPLNLFIGEKLLFLNKFHNVFLFLIFKLGLFGLVFYLLLALFLFQKSGDYTDSHTFLLKILFSFLIFVLPVVHGGFPMSISYGIILGFFIFLAEKKYILDFDLIETRQ